MEMSISDVKLKTDDFNKKIVADNFAEALKNDNVKDLNQTIDNYIQQEIALSEDIFVDDVTNTGLNPDQKITLYTFIYDSAALADMDKNLVRDMKIRIKDIDNYTPAFPTTFETRDFLEEKYFKPMAESENNVLEYHNQKDAMNFLKAKFTSKTLGSSTVDDMKVIGYALGKIAHDNDLVGRIDYDKMLRNLMLGKDRVETDLNRDFEPALEMMYGHLCNIADFGYEVAQQVFTNKISKGSPQCLPEGFTIRYIFNLNEF